MRLNPNSARIVQLLVSVLLAAGAVGGASAQTQCAAAQQSLVIYFGNGIDTPRESAIRSMRALERTFGTTQNGQTLSYELAYNQTSGIAIDLIQSAGQAGVQFGSQVVGWLNNLGLAPGWFNGFFQQWMRTAPEVISTEAVEHAKRYEQNLLLGQQVLVVAHSQGNFYVNEAKIQLSQRVSAEQMRGFSIMGVAVPANNVGGSNAPYFTNHRDVIQYVPGALPQNWYLRDAVGEPQTDLDVVSAHGFAGTYMSPDFNVRDPLVFGIRTLMADLKKPQPACDEYRKHLMRYFGGNYTMGPDGEFTMSINDDATVNFPYFNTRSYATSPVWSLKASYLEAPSGLALTSLETRRGADTDNYVWDGSGKLMGAPTACPPAGTVGGLCVTASATNQSFIRTRLSLAAWMALPSDGLHAVMWCKSALATSPVADVGTAGAWAAVEVQGLNVLVNGVPFDLAKLAKQSTAEIGDIRSNFPAVVPEDPDIELTASSAAIGESGTFATLQTSWLKGLRQFRVVSPSGERVIDCSYTK
jgi:hypothetical protein